MIGSQQVAVASTVANDDLVYQVLDVGALWANDTGEGHVVANELFDQRFKAQRRAMWTGTIFLAYGTRDLG